MTADVPGSFNSPPGDMYDGTRYDISFEIIAERTLGIRFGGNGYPVT